MLVPLSWLKEYVSFSISSQELADLLTRAGIEVESIVESDASEPFKETVLDLSLTPNLGHCMSIRGIAREISAMLGAHITDPPFTLKESEAQKTADVIDVEIKDPSICSFYSCRLIKGVEMLPTPSLIKQRLKAAGMRSLNLVVDVTNYVMLSTGQPLHPFDFQKIEGNKLFIDTSRQEFLFKTLDGKDRKVAARTPMIWDAKRPLAIAGIIGGADSEVDDATSSVILEAASFDPVQIRRSTKSLGLRTEASNRFEKGIDIDPHRITQALDWAAALIEQIGGGKLMQGRVETLSNSQTQKTIRFDFKKANALLGTELSLSEIESFLHRLDMQTVRISNDQILEVTLPYYRNDLSQEVDLIEEVARVYGYHNIKKKGKGTIFNSPPFHSRRLKLEKKVRTLLLQEGVQEFLTCPLISPKLSEIGSKKRGDSERRKVEMLQPSSLDQSVLRTSLLPGLLQSVKYNFDHQIKEISAFEIGKIYFKNCDDKFCEPLTLSLIMTGKKEPYHFLNKPRTLDFFDLKGVLENVLLSLGRSTPLFSPSHLGDFHPQRQAEIWIDDAQATPLGFLGEIHPDCLTPLDIDEPVLFAELDLEYFIKLKAVSKKIDSLPLFPSSCRDWTFSLRKESPIGEVLHLFDAFESKLLKQSLLLDVYEGSKVKVGYKNVTFRLTYRDDQKTVEQSQVDKEHALLVEHVSHHLRSQILGLS